MLTKEQLDELIQFAQDDRFAVSVEAVEGLNLLNAAVQRNLLRHLNGTRKRLANAQEKINRAKEKQTERIAEGDFEESNTDSVEVATALLYHLQQLRTYKLNKYKVQEILYEMYASWLESKKARLFAEHPVATEYGPRFWRVFKRLNTTNPVPYQEYKDFAAKRPDIAKFCKNAAAKYYDWAENELNRTFMKSKPYLNAHKDKNYGKWNKEITDVDIYQWKSKEN